MSPYVPVLGAAGDCRHSIGLKVNCQSKRRPSGQSMSFLDRSSLRCVLARRMPGAARRAMRGHRSSAATPQAAARTQPFGPGPFASWVRRRACAYSRYALRSSSAHAAKSLRRRRFYLGRTCSASWRVVPARRGKIDDDLAGWLGRRLRPIRAGIHGRKQQQRRRDQERYAEPDQPRNEPLHENRRAPSAFAVNLSGFRG